MKTIFNGNNILLKWYFTDAITGTDFVFDRTDVKLILHSCCFKDEIDCVIEGNTIKAMIPACGLPCGVYSVECRYWLGIGAKRANVIIHNAFQVTKNPRLQTCDTELELTSMAMPIFTTKIATVEYISEKRYKELEESQSLGKRTLYVVTTESGEEKIYLYNKTLGGESYLADEEDITLAEKIEEVENEYGDVVEKTTKVYKFKDRDTSKGMGHIILRSNKTLAEQVTEENTIYEIRYDFDLNGETLEIPEGCVLDFQGGSFSNGKIIVEGVYLQTPLARIFGDSLIVLGKISNTNIHPEWFGENGLERAIELFVSSSDRTLPTNKVIKLSGKTYPVENAIILDRPIRIEGEGWNTSIKYVGTEEIESIFTFNFNESIQNSSPYTTFKNLIISNNIIENGNGTKTRLAKRAIYGARVSALTVEWCRITNFVKAIDLAWGWNNKILYTILNDNETAIYTRTEHNNVLIVDSCSINANVVGMVAIAGKTINVINTAFEANHLALYINYLANTVNVKNCYFERNGIEQYKTAGLEFKSDIIINGSESMQTFSHEYLCKNINIQGCSIQNLYNDAFVTLVSGEGINISNNCLTKLDAERREYHVAQLHTVGYVRTMNVVAKGNVGFEKIFNVFQGGDVNYNQAFHTWKSDEAPINYALENTVEWTPDNSSIYASVYSDLFKNRWLTSGIYYPKTGTTDGVGFEINIDDYPELAGKLLNFGFYCKGNSDISQFQINIIYGDTELKKNYVMSYNYSHKQMFFKAPESGVVKIRIIRNYGGGIDNLLKITKVYLCVVGADVDLINYRFVNSSNYFIIDNGVKSINYTIVCTSDSKPVFSSAAKGKQAYLTDLNKPIWWTGSKWVNSDGTDA